jgi:hypothetical protein
MLRYAPMFDGASRSWSMFHFNSIPICANGKQLVLLRKRREKVKLMRERLTRAKLKRESLFFWGVVAKPAITHTQP